MNFLTKFIASLEVSKITARHDKPLSDGKFLKQATYQRFVQQSNHSERHIIKMTKNVCEQLKMDLHSCSYLSICLDESMDITRPT
jgi:hypothetical protein